MFKLKVNGGFLLLKPGTTIEQKLYSPLYSSDTGVFRDDVTIPFDVPNDAAGHNATLLGHPHVITSDTTFLKDTPARIFIGDLPGMQGVININTADATRFNITFSSGPGMIGTRIKSMSLRELMDHDFTRNTANTTEKQLWLSAPTSQDPVELEVNGTKYSAASLSALATAIGAGESNVTATFDGLNADEIHLKPTTGATDMSTPFAVKIPSGTAYWTLVDSKNQTWVDAYWLEWQNTIADYIANNQATEKCYYTTTVNQHLASDPARTAGTINGYNTSKLAPGFQLVSSTKRPLNNNSAAVYVGVQRIFDKIETEFSITIKGPLREDADLQDMLLYHPGTMDNYQPLIGNEPFLFWADTVNLRQLVPDIKVADFIKHMAFLFRMVLTWEPATATLTFVDDVPLFSSLEATDITAKASPLHGIYNIVPDGFTIKQTQPGADTFNETIADESNPYAVYTYGNGAEPIEIEARGVSQYGGFPTVNEAPGDIFPLRLMFYRGAMANATGTYEAADINNGTNSLAFFGSNNVVVKFWRGWIIYKLHEATAKTTIRYSAAELVNLDKLKKVRLPSGLFFIKDISVQVGTDSIQPAKVTLARSRVSNIYTEPTAPVLAWRGQESTAICLVDSNGTNTTIKRYLYIEEYDTGTTLATGNVSINAGFNSVLDVTDAISCPVQAVDLIYWASITTNGIGISIIYNGTGGYSPTNLPLPQPYTLPATTAEISLANSTDQRIRIVASVVDSTDTVVQSVQTTLDGSSDFEVAGPGNGQQIPLTGVLNLSFTPTAGDYTFKVITSII